MPLVYARRIVAAILYSASETKFAHPLLNVNYALFATNLTAYVVFLLSLSGYPPAAVVHRRAAYTLLGGALALLAYLDVFRKTRLWIRADRNEGGLKQAA